MTSAIALYAIIVVNTIYSGAHQLRGVSTWSLCSIWDSFVLRVRTKIVPRGHIWDVPHFGAPSRFLSSVPIVRVISMFMLSAVNIREI